MKLETIGICSWSLGNDPDRIAQTLKEAGLSCLHLDVSAADRFREIIGEKGWSVSCTMAAFPQEDYSTLESIRATGGIVPDDGWPTNRQIVLDAIETSAALGVRLLSFHAGFIDRHDENGFGKFCDRMHELADVAQAREIMLLMETGQETAEELRHFLDGIEHPALGVNFDPANMILYGKGDPIEAVHVLAPWIRHAHIKDAVAPKVPGEWGAEVPWGDGEVGCSAFITALEAISYTGALAIEREAGESRMADIKRAASLLGGLV